ncbi:T9SS type A sorting domain-containing protein [Flavobacterium sp.]|uniref:T9SS type A sorting domain-containing protein n=1 Tax=Flavobacterium sp. TaxID=239 RepID=UPI00286D89D0|nr:T9SS type A sorting domain-containing protein [Flavobacterium sp.]
MKKTILLLTLFNTFFAIARNKDEAKEAKLYPPGAPQSFAVNTLGNYYNSTTFTWTAPISGAAVSYYTIYLKRRTDAVFTAVNLSILSTTRSITLSDSQMPLPMNYELYITATSSTGEESMQSTHVFYEANQTNNAPGSPTLTNITTQGCLASWSASTSSNIIGYFIFANDVPVGFSTTTSYTIVGLHPNNTYNVTVTALDMYGNSSAESTTTANTDFTTLDYCKPATIPKDADNYNANAYIQQVSIASQLTYPTFARTSSTGNTYNNFTDVEITNGSIPTLTLGSAKPGNIIKVTAAPIGGSETDVFIFIDFDFDGVFEASEKVACGFLSYKGTTGKSVTDNIPVTFVSDMINVPSTAFIGTVRMRIIYQQINSSTNTNTTTTTVYPCDFLSNYGGNTVSVGEIQDYSVTIVNPNPIYGRVGNGGSDIIIKEPIAQDSKPEKPDPTNLTIYPNPVSGDFMNITAIDNNTPYAIYNVAGQEVSTGKVNNGTINVANLSKGNYLLQVQVNDQRIVKQFIKQ